MVRPSPLWTVLAPAAVTGSHAAPHDIRLSRHDTPDTASPARPEQADSSLRGALRTTPGITLTAGEGGAALGEHALIRGFRTRSDVSGSAC